MLHISEVISKYVNHTIKQKLFLLSFVNDIEDLTSKITGTKKAVAVVNGTSAINWLKGLSS